MSPPNCFLLSSLTAISLLCCYFVGNNAQINPVQIVTDAVLCLKDKFIYTGCDEEYRLDQSGDLHVPCEAVNRFCYGPCLSETRTMLKCIDKLASGFRFLNKATTEIIRNALDSGCSYTPQRGQTAVNDSVQATGEDLLCFKNKLIYTGCDEAFRLNQSGTINVPRDETDRFCNGPCLLQTKVLLTCVEKIDSSYVFNNEATTKNIRKALDAGCSNSTDRGNFNVGDYIQGGLNNLGSGISNMGLLARSWIFCMFIIFITNH